jgi:UDP-N-acetylmuramoyl-tripeptide--D-alanyl-D-alanine ligase
MINGRDLALSLADVLDGSGDRAATYSDQPFNDVVIDSRKVQPGDLFVALAGENTDGHKYLDDAVQRGATGLLTRKVPETLPDSVNVFLVADTLSALQQAAGRWRQRQRVHVIGITGSVGKTTTREAVAHVFRGKCRTLESPRNYNSEIGLPIALLGLDAGHEWAVIEIGPYDQQEMTLLCDLAKADVGLVTNVGPTHLERFGSIEATTEIKGTLVATLPPSGVAVLNADDDRTRSMGQRTEAAVITYGLHSSADVRASDVASHGLDGLTFTLHHESASVAVRTPLAGTHHVMTALAAAGAALAAGHVGSAAFDLEEISDALSTLEAGSRLKPRKTFAGALILDDVYNAAPLSMRAALDLLSELPGRRTAVLGDMLELGEAEESAHREVGAYCVGRCDRLIAVGRRARGIADGAWDAGHEQIQWFEEQDSATAQLRQELGADDVVLIKASHGMALERMVTGLVEAVVTS